MYATERFFLVLKDGSGEVLAVRRTRDEASAAEDEILNDTDDKTLGTRVVERWYTEANLEEKRAIESLMS